MIASDLNLNFNFLNFNSRWKRMILVQPTRRTNYKEGGWRDPERHVFNPQPLQLPQLQLTLRCMFRGNGQHSRNNQELGQDDRHKFSTSAPTSSTSTQLQRKFGELQLIYMHILISHAAT